MAYNPQRELAQATDTDFERAALPFLQILWPDLTRASPRGYWDRRGIDLITDVETFPVRCCVQCKGFAVPFLGPEQYQKMAKSIQAFRRSALQTDRYILVHNRDGRNRAGESKIEEDLNELVTSGQAIKAELWDRQTLFKRLKAAIREILARRISEANDSALRNLERLYGPRWAWQYHVPVAEQRLRFQRRHGLADCTQLSSYISKHIKETLFGDETVRWTMVTGWYGIGKTTATLLAAHDADYIVVRTECRRFREDTLGGGFHALTKEITRSLEVEPPVEDCRTQFEYLAGRELADLLCNPEYRYALIIDGLDENRHYSRKVGLARLTSQLAPVRSPIILVTRREHFKERLGDISTAMSELSTYHGPGREAAVFDLGYWSKTDLLHFLGKLSERYEDAEKDAIETLRRFVADGTAEELYGSGVFHPLFLSFIIDDLIHEGLRTISQTSLIEGWVSRKILRDCEVDRVSVGGEEIDGARLVELMFRLTEKVARRMVVDQDGKVELREDITEDEVLDIAKDVFAAGVSDVLGVVLHSVLVTNGPRRIGGPLRLSFPHRMLQEYFTARAFVHESGGAMALPPAIATFYQELTAGRRPREAPRQRRA